MTIRTIFLLVVVALVALPVLSYLVVKFGRAGWLNAKGKGPTEQDEKER